MKNKEYTLIPDEVPPPEMTHLRELVSKFRASGQDTARIGGTEGRSGAMRIRTYLHIYISRSGIRDVKVVIRGDKIYLVKKEG